MKHDRKNKSDMKDRTKRKGWKDWSYVEGGWVHTYRQKVVAKVKRWLRLSDEKSSDET